MTTIQLRQLAEALDTFAATYGSVLETALRGYAEVQQNAGDTLLLDYNRIKDDPAERASQDASLITTEGLRLTAGAIHESARKGREALDAWEKLTDVLDGARGILNA